MVAFIAFITVVKNYTTKYSPIEIKEDQGILDIVSNILANESFYYSFIASAYEDLLFFGIVGILITIYSMTKPTDEPLDNRLNTLFTNHKDINSVVFNDIKDEIKEASVYSPFTELSIVVLDKITLGDNTLLKVSVNRRVHLQSLIHDIGDVNTKGKILFYGETNVDIPCRLDGTKEYGEIELVELIYNSENNSSLVINQPLTESKTEIKVDETFKKNSDFTLHSKFWMWMLDGDIYEHTAFRTTSKLKVSVLNKLKDDIVLSYNNEQVTVYENLEHILETEKYMKMDEIVSFNVNIKENTQHEGKI